jgi:hypothetical protein
LQSIGLVLVNIQLPLRGSCGNQSLVRSSIDHTLEQFLLPVPVVLVVELLFVVLALVLVVVFVEPVLEPVEVFELVVLVVEVL